MGLFTNVAERIDRRWGWDHLPLPVAMLVLIGLRNRLRAEEPLRHGPRPARQARRVRPPALPDRAHARRHVQRPRRPADGQPRQPLRPQRPARATRSASRRTGCSSRTRGSSAASCSRATSSSRRRRSTCSPARGSSSRCTTGSATARTRRRTRGSCRSPTTTRGPSTRCRSSARGRDPSADPSGPPTFVTDDTHWWDGSQIYGRDPAFADALRSGEHGKLRIDEHGLPPQRPRGARRPRRRRRQLLGRARAAALAVHARAQRGLRPPARDASRALRRRALRQGAARRRGADGEDPHGRLDAGDHRPPDDGARRCARTGGASRASGSTSTSAGATTNEVIRGIPGSPTNHHGVPYSLTEEFVVRLPHAPADPGRLQLPLARRRRGAAGAHAARARRAARARAARPRCRWPTCSTRSARRIPGAITLHNFPRFLQHFDRADGALVDLASIDVLRVRERGVPRYNEFRRLLHLKAFDTFEEMADTPEHAEELRRIYGDVERVDLMIGMYAERKPKGFGFSDTAFRIFILMASRRLESDRFFTRDYRPEVYTQRGHRLGREQLDAHAAAAPLPRARAGAARTSTNPFAPWQRAAS